MNASAPAALSPARLRIGLVAVFASTFLGLVSLFLFFPLLLFTLKGMGWSDAQVGVVAAAEWLGLALGTPFVAGWVKRLGLRWAFMLSGLIPAAAFVLIALTPWPVLWTLLILLGGMAGSMRWIVAEASVTEMAPPERRGLVVGLFGTMLSLTYVIGPALLAWIGTEGEAAERARWTAVAIAVVGLLCALPVPALDSHRHHRPEDLPPRLGLRGILDALRVAPFLLVAGAVGGFFEAGSTGVLPLYGLAVGMTAGMSALLVSAAGLGGVLTMAPVGILSDRLPMRPLRLACGVLIALASALTLLVPQWPPLGYGVAFVWGGAGGAIYTLAMVDAGRRGKGVELVNFTAVLVLSYTLGGTLAPLLGGLALSLAPGWGLSLLMTAVATLATVLMFRDRGSR
jgi:MFS family permease